MDRDTSFLLSLDHCFSYWYHLDYGRTWDYSLWAGNRGAADMIRQRCASTLITVSSCHQFTDIFTDYFSRNTKYLLLILFLVQPRSLHKSPITLIKPIIFFNAHWWGFIQRKNKTLKEDLIMIIVINTEAARPGQTRISQTSRPVPESCRFPLHSLFPPFWSLTASASSPAVPHNHLTSSFSFPFDILFLRGPNIFVESVNSV